MSSPYNPPKPGTVDVWVVRYREQCERLAYLARLLSEAERTRADSFLDSESRTNYILRRASLREIVANYTSETPEKVVIAVGSFGKPHLSFARDLHINITRAADLFMVAVSDCEIGIDVEKIRWLDDIDTLAQSVMNANELRAFATLAETGKLIHFLQIWTVKEASLKAIGIGLRADPKRIDVTAHAEIGRYAVMLDRNSTAEPLFARSIAFDKAYVATLASGRELRINVRRARRPSSLFSSEGI